MVKISVKLAKENKKLEKKIINLKDYVELLENDNKILKEEITSIRSNFLRSNI